MLSAPATLTGGRQRFVDRLAGLAQIENGVPTIRMTFREIGDALDLSAGTVGAHLRYLAARGVISTDRGIVRILSPFSQTATEVHEQEPAVLLRVVAGILALADRYPDLEYGLAQLLAQLGDPCATSPAPVRDGLRDDRARTRDKTSRVLSVVQTEREVEDLLSPSTTPDRATDRADVARLTERQALRMLSGLAEWETARSGQQRNVAPLLAVEFCWLTAEQLEAGIAKAKAAYPNPVKTPVGFIVSKARDRDLSWFTPPPSAVPAALPEPEPEPAVEQDLFDQQVARMSPAEIDELVESLAGRIGPSQQRLLASPARASVVAEILRNPPPGSAT